MPKFAQGAGDDVVVGLDDDVLRVEPGELHHLMMFMCVGGIPSAGCRP